MDCNKLRSKRLEKKLTQEQISKSLKMSPISYCRKERGNREFSCSEISKLYSILELTDNDVKQIFLV